MNDIIEQLGYLAGGSRLRRIYEKLQVDGDKAYKEAGFDFKSSWFPVYYVLAKSDSPQTIMEITSQIAFSHITVKNIIRELEKKELILIVPNPQDRRSKLVSLSDKGFILQKNMEPIWQSFSSVIENLFTEGHPDIMHILSKIDAALHSFPLNERVRNQNRQEYSVRNATRQEFEEIGKLKVLVYSQLEGFPKQSEQPNYYKMLADVGELTKKPQAELLVAVSSQGKIVGSVVYFGNMKFYGSGGTATKERNAAGFRLLAVDPLVRGQGIGKLLTKACIQKARDKNLAQIIIHTTMAMQTGWKMYEKIGFKRSEDLDFRQGKLPVFGFRLVF